MEITTPKLITAAKVLAAFNAVTNDAELNTNSESAELLKDLARLFIHKPIGEIVGSVGNNADAVHSALLRSSEQLGAAPKIDITGLRIVVKKELAKMQAASVGL